MPAVEDLHVYSLHVIISEGSNLVDTTKSLNLKLIVNIAYNQDSAIVQH